MSEDVPRSLRQDKLSENPHDELDCIFEYFDEKQIILFNRLKDFIEFRTVSSDPAMRSEIYIMIEVLIKILGKFGMHSQTLTVSSDDDDTPPILLAETTNDPNKRTVCVYAHFDVLPPTFQDSYFNTFELSVNSDETELQGKGTSVGKGPLLCVINAIGAYQQLKIPLPVNVKLVLDPMGTSENGDKAGKYLRSINHEFFFNVDYVCLALGHWLTDSKPCISHGCRGICYFHINIDGPSKNLPSGAYGGMINEPMTDMVFLLNQLVDKYGSIQIAGIYEDVPPVTKEERNRYKNVYFNVRDYKLGVGSPELLANEDKASILMNLWRKPSLSIHGIQAHSPVTHTTNIIPKNVTGKFSITLVPNMTPSKVKKAVFDHLNKLWKSRRSPNRIVVQMTVGKPFWFTDPEDGNSIAARNAVRRVYHEEPDMIRESHRVKLVTILKKITDSPVIGIPLSKRSDVSDDQMEKIDVQNYINGAKIFAAYFDQLGKTSPLTHDAGKKKCTCNVTEELNECSCYLTKEHRETEDKYESRAWSRTYSNDRILEDPEIKYHYYSELAKKRMVELNKIMNDGGFEMIKLKALPRFTSSQDNERVPASDNFQPNKSMEDVSVKVSDCIANPWTVTGTDMKTSTEKIRVVSNSSRLLCTIGYNDKAARKSLTGSMRDMRSSLCRSVLADSLSMASRSLVDISKTNVEQPGLPEPINKKDHKSRECVTAVKSSKIYKDTHSKLGAKGCVPSKIIQEGLRSPINTTESASAKELSERQTSSLEVTLASSKLQIPQDDRDSSELPLQKRDEDLNISESTVISYPMPPGLSPISPKEIISSTSRLFYENRLKRMTTISTTSLAGSSSNVSLPREIVFTNSN